MFADLFRRFRQKSARKCHKVSSLNYSSWAKCSHFLTAGSIHYRIAACCLITLTLMMVIYRDIRFSRRYPQTWRCSWGRTVNAMTQSEFFFSSLKKNWEMISHVKSTFGSDYVKETLCNWHGNWNSKKKKKKKLSLQINRRWSIRGENFVAISPKRRHDNNNVVKLVKRKVTLNSSCIIPNNRSRCYTLLPQCLYGLALIMCTSKSRKRR